MLNVTAKDKSTGKEQSIRIEANSGLSDEDIEKMKADAEAHADEDKQKQELIEVRNMAEQMIYTAEKSVKDHGEAAGEEVVNAINEKMTALKEVKDKDDKAAIQSATEALSNELQKIGEIMNQDNQAEAAPAEGEEETPKDGNADVRDAEVTNEEKKEDSQ